MGNVEDTLQKILIDLKNSRFEHEIPKKELILLITKYTQSPYGYLNRLLIDMYIKIVAEEKLYEILSTDYKGCENGQMHTVDID